MPPNFFLKKVVQPKNIRNPVFTHQDLNSLPTFKCQLTFFQHFQEQRDERKLEALQPPGIKYL